MELDNKVLVCSRQQTATKGKSRGVRRMSPRELLGVFIVFQANLLGMVVNLAVIVINYDSCAGKVILKRLNQVSDLRRSRTPSSKYLGHSANENWPNRLH